MSEQEKRQLNSSTEGIDTQNTVEIWMTLAIFETSSEKQVTKSLNGIQHGLQNDNLFNRPNYKRKLNANEHFHIEFLLRLKEQTYGKIRQYSSATLPFTLKSCCNQEWLIESFHLETT